eukprot:1159839-Pelagomonas_calceolata.AAC.21
MTIVRGTIVKGMHAQAADDAQSIPLQALGVGEEVRTMGGRVRNVGKGITCDSQDQRACASERVPQSISFRRSRACAPKRVLRMT